MGRDHHGDPLPEVRRIALFTDFGPEGIYIGQMRAVLADAGLPVFDLMNQECRYLVKDFGDWDVPKSFTR
ncbi:MAG: hypothetical protein AB2807_01340 [Candidatus Sedimenticola endophacoides]